MALGFIDLGINGHLLVIDEVSGLPIGVQNTQGFGAFVNTDGYHKASLPTALYPGQMIYVVDATGAHVTGSMAFWNANTGHWIDVTTGIAVA